MGECRCVLMATVLKVHNSIPLYPYCQRCYSKLDFESKKKLWQCSQCSNKVNEMDVTYRFRLSITIADRHAVADVSIFGQCLDAIFGSTANKFQKYLKHVEDSHHEIDANSLLQSAERNSLVGNQFYFGFKVVRKTTTEIKGLEDLVQHHSRNGKPRSIVACQAIEPFQNSQNLTVIQFVKHSIHCLLKSTAVPSCSSELCYCTCNEEINRKQSFRKSNTFICSGSSTGSTQRKLSTNSLLISYEESLNASSQTICSQPSVVSDVLQNHRESLQTTKIHELEDKDRLYSCKINDVENHNDSYIFTNKFTNYGDDKTFHKVEDDGTRIGQDLEVQQDSKSSEEANESTSFPDDLPFFEDLDDQVEDNGSDIQDLKVQHDSTSSEEANESTAFPDDLPFSEDLELFLKKVDARHAEGDSSDVIPNKKELSMKILSEQHSNVDKVDTKHAVGRSPFPDVQPNKKELPMKIKSDIASEHNLKGECVEILDNGAKSKSDSTTNLSYLNELPFSNDFELFLQQLENNYEDKEVKSSPLSSTHSEEHLNVIYKENNLQCRSENNILCHSVGNLKRKSAMHCSVMAQPWSTPTYPVPFKRRNGFRQSCKILLQHKQNEELTTTHQVQDSPSDNYLNTKKETNHKNQWCSSLNALEDEVDRNASESRLSPDPPSKSLGVNDCPSDLFSQSLFSPSSCTKKDRKSLTNRTTLHVHSKSLIERKEHTNSVGNLSGLKTQFVTHTSQLSTIATLQPCRFSTPKYPVTFRKSSLRESSKGSLNQMDHLVDHQQPNSNMIKIKDASLKPSSSPKCIVGLGSLPDLTSDLSDCSPDLFSSQSIFYPSSITKIDTKSLKKKTRSLSKNLMERMIKLKKAQRNGTERKLSHKSCLISNSHKVKEPLKVCQTVKSNSLNNSDILTQQLFDSPGDASTSYLSFEIVKNWQMQNVSQSSSKHTIAKQDHPSVKQCAVSLEVIEPLPNEVCHCSPDLFSQSFLHSNSFCESPDLFSSSCEDVDPNKDVVNNDRHTIQSIVACNDSLSMQLFTSSEDSD